MKAFSDHSPEIIEPVGNGNYLYHWDIQEIDREIDRLNDNTPIHIKQYAYQEVTVYPPLTSNNITKAVINSMWDSNYEQKLVNEYNAAELGVYDDEEALNKVDKYKEFLATRNAIKKQVDKDCKNLGIL